MLIDFREQLTADVLFPRGLAAHQAARGRNDIDAIAAQHARNLMRTNIHAPSGSRHPRQMRNRRGAARVVAQEYAHYSLRALAFDDEVIDIAFLFEDARDLQLQFRSWDINPRMFGGHCIPNSRHHVGNRISHSLNSIFDFQLPIANCRLKKPIGNRQSKIGNASTSSISPRRESVPATPAHESKCDTNETCADRLAAGHIACSACTRVTKTFACDSTSLLKISLPYHCLNGIPKPFKSARACSSSRAVVTIEIFIPRCLSTLLKSISGKISCSLIPIV